MPVSNLAYSVDGQVEFLSLAISIIGHSLVTYLYNKVIYENGNEAWKKVA